MTVGEAPFSHSAADLVEYVLPENKELNMVFQFELMDIDSIAPLDPILYKKWSLSDLKHIVEKWQTFEKDRGFWNAQVELFDNLGQLTDGEIKVCLSRITINLVRSRDSETILLSGALPLPSFCAF
jgi:alpha-glucosidase